MRFLPILLLLACLGLAACAASDSKPDDNSHGGFYGGVTGGVAR